MNQPRAGILHVVATPIGNLEDLSPRARRVLAEVSLIAAEDTRHTQQLLSHFGIATPLLALHEHNEAERAGQVVARLRAGEDVALVSDAGTPLVSDPGFRLLRELRAEGLEAVPVPGPCAAIAALSVAGLPSDRFCFEGFLPAKAGARRARLEALASEPRTMVFYESSHRIADMLADAASAFGDERDAFLGREISKRFETFIALPLGALAARVAGDADQQRGEMVVVVAGAPESADARLAEGRRVLAVLSKHLAPSQAARLAAEISGAPRKALYSGAE